MANDDRDILELLKEELDFIEKGGYGRSVRTPWKPTSIFQDSLACFGFPDHLHEDCCRLMEFVPAGCCTKDVPCHYIPLNEECRTKDVPCHYIPLNEAGETVEDLELEGNQSKTERKIKEWLRNQIKKIEEQRVGQRTSS